MLDTPVNWIDDRRCEIDGTSFTLGMGFRSTPTNFVVAKEPGLVRSYLTSVSEFEGGNIVELGIAEGGSSAMVALAAVPQRLVALDLAPDRVDALDRFIADRSLGDVVHLHYGIDQSDGDALRRIVAEEFGDRPLDLVIDDASHLGSPTRASFEVLFPRLRPGGLYIIEDWNWEHRWADLSSGAEVVGPDVPAAPGLLEQMGRLLADDPGPERRLLDLVLRLVLARASMSEAIGVVTVDPWWISVRRGTGALPMPFSLDHLSRDHFDLLSSSSRVGGPP